MRSLALTTVITALVFLFATCGHGINYGLSQPQIYVDDGHLYFVPAEHRNLVLISNGTGKIIFNDVQLDKLVGGIKNLTREQKSIRRIFGNPSNSSTSGVARRLRRLEQQMGQFDQLETLDGRIVALERQLTGMNGTSGGSSGSGEGDQTQPSTSNSPRALRRRMTALERRVRDLVARNPCSSNPCQNAGTCIPTIFGPFCYCQSGWEGDRCQVDVNECGAFAGSGLGCQNGAQCVNTPGSYQCNCRSGWLGIHCTMRSGDCSSGPSWELCGHGICVNQHTGSRPYTCICEQGWKTDGTNPACSVDVDECNGPHSSCSINPFVTCVNTPGSFHCGPCPAGYTGNGYQCTDINECIQNNGGCSTNPYVQCINTVGSRTCGECPPGYIGNGVTCQYIGMCQINNGGCHPLARCVQNPAIGQSYVQCLCPPGFTGSGMGPQGCFPYGGGGGGTDVGPIGPGPCASNPCAHGTCIPNGINFLCTCLQGYTGPTCSVPLNPCLSSPCQNGGTCSPSADGFICHCANDFTGLRCERQEESCGGTITGVEGTLRYPHDSSQNYRHNANCMWTLRSELGKVLNLTFTRFHLEGGGAVCGYDWLQIHDGFDSQAPLIGKYCGDTFPNGGSIVSTHEAMFLWFRSDHSTTGLGFEFNWNSTDAVCGGTLTGLTHGSINSPGYPGNYPHNRDCLWTISVSLSKRIQLVFATLQLEIHPNCSYDFLQVRDGLEEMAPILGMYCNTTLPPPLVSSGPYLRLLLHTDSSAADMGFHVTFAEVPGVPGCGGVYSESQGVFSSPQHPEPYAHGLDCEYLIRLPTPDERITLTFTEFELESGPNCRFDFVEIRDGSRPDSPLIGRFCERNRPPVIRSSSNVLLVRFRSDASISFGGFRAKYESVCGGTFSTDTGILRSPYYPQPYPKNRDCIYIISQPVSKAIRLDFSDFDVEGNTPNSCLFDYLEVRDGDTENSTLIGHFCGPPQAKPDPILSTFNYLWLRFKTDGSVQNRGFLGNFSTVDVSCGGILREAHGVVSSPGHPEVYPHGVDCTWIIRGVPGQVIRLNWLSFSLERNTRCRFDYVEMFDNSTLLANNNGSLIGRYCGQDPPPQVTSSDYTMTIRFKSDHSVAHDGFMANYVLVNASTVCGANYLTEVGLLQSPGYPVRYPPGKSCVWTIRVPVGQQIMLNVTDFDLENGTGSGCPYDFLEIRNGGLQTSPLVGKFCGGTYLPPRLIPSSSNSLYLKFSTDSSRSGRGFRILWDGTSTGCGSTLKGPSGSLVSPNYPSSSGIRTECVWNILVNQGSAIQFTFVDLDLQRSSNCWGEYVELRDGPRPDSPLLGKYCIAESTLAINSTGSSIRVKFVSRQGATGRGFHASYQTICSRQIRGFSGVIESPNFPDPYPHNRNCSWDVLVTRGNKVNISFSHFSVEDPHPITEHCRYDFVEVNETSGYEHGPLPSTSLGKFCGTLLPPMISTNKDNAIVHFESDASLARNGFRLEWVVNGCGGRIVGNWGVLKSPNYPRPYPSSVICEWYIETPLGTRASLTVSDLDMEKAVSCVYDSLSVYAGPDDKSALLTQLCHKPERSVTVTGHGNKMFVRFVADSTVNAKGFYGYVNQLEGGCGGTYTAPTGFIYSPNYPSNYDHDDDCGWRIRVDENHVVELTFLDFMVERHINCSYDHVAVYDGYSASAPLLLLHCGSEMPEPPRLRSTGSTMYVRLKTDGSTSSKGFKANYTTACGARLGGSGRTQGTINSPGFPLLMFRLNCTWFITGQRPEDRVTLTFTHMDIQTTSNENCVKDYVEVLDGEDLEAPSVGKFCFSRVPPAITSQGNSLVIRISTQDSWGFGFRANYDISSGACGGELTSAEGSFVSPNFPHGYPPSSECVWNIKASQGNRVHISFRRMDIEATDFCNTDFVEVHESGPSGPLLGHFCGNEIPANITAARELWVLFRTDAEGQAPGFLADYSLVHGNELSGSRGYVESPLYPLPLYMLGTYTWRILVNQSQAIRIRFNAFDFEFDSTTDSCGNFLKIFDGYDENSPQLLYSCDKNIPEVVVSTGNVVQIVQYRGYPRVSSIFQLTWEEVSMEVSRNASATRPLSSSNVTGCGGTVDLWAGNDTSLMSPGYPGPPGYQPNLYCEWIVNSPPNYRIQLKVEDMEIESHSTCQYDRLDVYDVPETGGSNYVLNQTLCQRTQKDMILVSAGRSIKLVFITDASVSRPGFNLTLTAACGGIVRDTRGRISSPNFPQNYGHAICTWVVNVRPGRTINVVIRTMDIYRGPQTECSTDILTLRNGGHANSPFLGPGRFCGNTIPTIPETIGNQLYVRFQAYTSGGRGFELIYNEVSIGCGAQIHLTDDAGVFPLSSPNYPAIPPPFTECEWVFTVPQNEVVQLDFQLSLQLRSSSGCSLEGVEVRDGGTPNSPMIITFCGNNGQLPPTQKSTGNSMYVRYYTNSNEPQNGFKAQASIATCGGTVVGWSGTITSPGFPVSYDANLDCWWTIRGPSSSFLNLEFTDLEIGTLPFRPNTNVTGTPNCTRDLVQITEENITEIASPRTWNFCSISATASLPAGIQSSTNQIHVRFRSDASRETRKGFQLRFTRSIEQCGGTLEGQPSGMIQSPNYPQTYPHYRYCDWTIKAPADRRVRLEFLDFDLEEKILTPTRSYCVDYVTVMQTVEEYGGWNSFKLYNDSLCGISLPPPVETTTNVMILRFRTDGSVAHRGFRARFTTDLPNLCGGPIVGDSGVVTSPMSRTGTPNETSTVMCSWKHAGEGDNATTIITIQDLKVPPWGDGNDPGCPMGFLQADPGSQSYSWKKYCGRQSNLKLYIPGSSFEIKYSVMHWESSFNLTYQVIGCGGVVTQPNGTIQSPGFPSSYPPNIECIWKVNFRRGQVQLTITDLDLDDHQDDVGCDRDYLVIRNGLYPSSPILGKYCGTNIPPAIISMSQGLWVEFHSDENGNGNRRGFRIETSILEKGCGGTIHNKMGTLRSPRPRTFQAEGGSRYPNNVECEWVIETVPGYMVNLQFDGRFDIETQTNCSADFVEISEKKGSRWSFLGRYCGRQVPPPINTTSTTVQVLFRSNAAVNGDGFNLNWYSVCGGIFTEESGMIRSAHYDRYNHSAHVNEGSFWSRGYVGWENRYRVQECDYTIQGNSSNDYIVLQFQAPFDISVPASEGFDAAATRETCPIVNLTLHEGNATEVRAYPYYYRRLGQFCGVEVPPNGFLGRGALTLVYNYMAFYQTYGFRAEYNIYRCGGEVNEATSIQSPGHPFTSAPNMNCTWVIRSPPGKVVRFKFERMELEYSPLCGFDYVKLFNGDWGNEEMRLGTFCGNLTEDISRILSTGTAMTIQFITDHSIHHSGFKGSIDFTIGPSGGCGGRINGSNGAVQNFRSPDSDNDGKYDPYLDCQWLVIGPDFQVLDLTFTTFTLEGNRRSGTGTSRQGDDCPFDFVEIRDGPGPAGPLLGRFCGSSPPPRMSSSSNFLWINFVSDGSYHFPGFRASISSRQSPCGIGFVLNATGTTQVLKSPSYPSNYPSNLRCRWTLDGARFNDEVDVRFLDLDIEPSSDCSKDRLQIRDISSSYTSPEGIGGPILFNGNQATDWRFRHLDDIDTATIMNNFKYCGSATPSDFVSIGRSLEILFETDTSGTGRGFQVEYRAAGCNRTYESSQGRIFSPEWPSHSPIFTNCVKMIRAHNSSTISLYFNTFLLEESESCGDSFFEVREGSSNGEIRGRFCGTSLPYPIFSTSNVLWINYLTRLHPNRGFDFSYSTTTAGIGCGGDLFHTGGSFTSPFYPGNYSQSGDCTWRIRVPAGLKINLVFTSFLISGDCADTFLEILSMNSHEISASPTLFTRYCPGDIPSPYNGETDMAMVRYKSSLNNTGMGWRIEFRGRQASADAASAP